jgi:hypothetical protein
MRKQLRYVTLSLATGLFAQAALAVSGFVEMSHIAIEVVDLDTSDGIPASYRLFSEFPVISLARVTWGRTELVDTTPRPPPTFGLNGDSFASVSGFNASMSASTDNGLHRSVGSSARVFPNAGHAGFSGGTSVGLGFDVTPNTQLIMSAEAFVQAVGDVNCGTLDAVCGKVTSQARLGYVYYDDTGHSQGVADLLAAVANESGTGGSDSTRRRLEVVYTNDSDEEVELNLIAWTALLSTSVGPLPEAQTWLLLLTGLGLVALAARRRRDDRATVSRPALAAEGMFSRRP